MPSSSDLITVNPLCDLVTFEDIPQNYPPDQDIFVIYQLGESFEPTSKDWVGLYRFGWSNLSQYLAFQWSPKYPRNERFPTIRSVLFLSKELKGISSVHLNDHFQFLYVSKGSHIVGVSRKFSISNVDTTLLHCVDRAVDNFGSLTFIEVDTPAKEPSSTPRGILEGYDLLASSDSESGLEESQPLLAEAKEDATDSYDALDEWKVVPYKKWEIVPFNEVPPRMVSSVLCLFIPSIAGPWRTPIS